ncbi:MAG: ABC transporter ATP-binding protein [Bacteroidetes bacterium]|nr:ABC transporter ATP-binding protein [Bacteroidota bacterium]MCK4360656.1 ABC transporter ATP-binding protein [Bacteroidales bacterium]
MNTISVQINGISKSYKNIKALDNINLSIKKGELFGFIGPDGAGKTSLFRILTTLLFPDEGTAKVEEFDVVADYKEIRKIAGYMPGRFSLYQDLSVKENLNFFASIFKTTVQENYELIRDIYSQIEPFKDRLAGNLSGGMKQKLALSCALIHKPEVLFLDEPTTGVDAVSRKEFWEMLKRLKEKGITILVSTPYMDEASLCDRVALIQKGKIMSVETPQNIIDNFKYPLAAVQTNNMYELLYDLKQNKDVYSAFRFGESIHITEKKSLINTDEIEEYLKLKGHKHIDIKIIKPNIEDCFMALMEEQ